MLRGFKLSFTQALYRGFAHGHEAHQQKGRPLTLPESTMYGYICVQMCCFGGIYGHVLTHKYP